MTGFSVYYIEALVACMLMFGMLLLHNHYNIDRQEKQIKFDRVLIAFILYFVADCFWAAFTDGLIPKTRTIVLVNDFAVYVLMAAICYFWLEYVMAVEQRPHRNRPINRFAVIFPFLVATVVMIIHYLISPQSFLNDSLDAQPTYSVYLMTVPVIYLAAILFYTLTRAREEENPVEKRKHIFMGALPVLTIIGGVIQEAYFPHLPIYCFIDSLLILTFYIQSIGAQVSIDPLTKLNNRGQMMRYISQRSNLYQEERRTIVVMMDINRFKMINDTYGHAEGDKALMIIANLLKKVAGRFNMPSFLGRYGGDEFILIIHPENGADVDRLITEMRDMIRQEILKEDLSYVLSLSVGYDELKDSEDTIQDCMNRADQALYEDKRGEQAAR